MSNPNSNPIETQSKTIAVQTERLYNAGHLIEEIEKALFGYDKPPLIKYTEGAGGAGAPGEDVNLHFNGAIETLENEVGNLLAATDYLANQLAKLNNRLLGQ